MLVLSRRLNERIVIDGSIEIMVVDIRGDKVRLGIVAPKHLEVHRKEVLEKIKAEGSRRTASANSGTPDATVRL